MFRWHGLLLLASYISLTDLVQSENDLPKGLMAEHLNLEQGKDLDWIFFSLYQQKTHLSGTIIRKYFITYPQASKTHQS